jgi:hypothetical protein
MLQTSLGERPKWFTFKINYEYIVRGHQNLAQMVVTMQAREVYKKMPRYQPERAIDQASLISQKPTGLLSRDLIETRAGSLQPG